jgi:opacity protein-like surface antigen
MKKIVVLLFAAALVFTASLVSAEDLYISANVGTSLLNDSTISFPDGKSADAEFDAGLILRGAVGTNLGMGRLEGEVGYRSHGFDNGSGDITAFTFLLNGYYDIPANAPVTPFIGGGIGFANINVDGMNIASHSQSDADDTVFAYQIGAGFSYPIDELMTLDCGYRYLGATDPDFKGTEAEYGTHNFTIGLRYAIQSY